MAYFLPEEKEMLKSNMQHYGWKSMNEAFLQMNKFFFETQQIESTSIAQSTSTLVEDDTSTGKESTSTSNSSKVLVSEKVLVPNTVSEKVLVSESTSTEDKWRRSTIKCPYCSSDKFVVRLKEGYLCESCEASFRESGKEDLEYG